MKNIWMILICFLMFIFGICNGTQVKEQPNLQKSETMCIVTEVNWGECNSADDYWCSTTYEVSYDGKIRVSVQYNISGNYEDHFVMTEEDYNAVYDNISKMKYKDTASDGCDGTCWRMSFEGEDVFYGYIGNGKEKEVATVLLKYEKMIEITK